MAESGRIDFPRLAESLLARANVLLPQWLPGGKLVGQKEYVCADLSGGAGTSCSINIVKGVWKDFASGEGGGDLISLYAAIHGMQPGRAARQLMEDLGWQHAALALRHAQAHAPMLGVSNVPQHDNDLWQQPADDEGAVASKRSSAKWQPIAPVPRDTPVAQFKHWHHGQAQRSWRYARDGELYGYVCRFDKPASDKRPNGGKEILPLTWCVDASDQRGTRRWEWKQWNEPRPLYLAAGSLASDPIGVPVVLVEGEKCADAGQSALPEEYDWVSWPGGSQAWQKADWAWLRGRTIYLWPDCDAKRQRLSKTERDAGVDPASRPLLPAAKQPGMQAMLGIGTRLVAELGCRVWICPIPQPGQAPDGWDLADAIEDGWDAEAVRAFLRGARAFQPASNPAVAATRSCSWAAPSLDNTVDMGVAPAWPDSLLTSASGAVKAVRENIVLALDGLPDQGVQGIPECAGIIRFNDFTNDVLKTQATPWGTPAGVWDEVDELELGNWLTRTHELPSMSRGTLEEAVAMVAKRHRFHPVRDELSRLEGMWDRQPRLRTWLRRCCLEATDWDDADPLQQYLARVGTWLIMAICARVLEPGCKFDYMVILEGAQGIGKSTLSSLLGGDYFADTGLVLGDKDSYQNLQGVLVYEWGELDSLNRSEVTKVKQFISSQKDRFRASFDRRPKDYPRQVVFIGTTNEDHYLVDPTGNRRFWPVRVTRQIDLAWFREHREQLFAEALAYLASGERFHPTPKEQRELFDAQQQQRQIENAIQAAVMRYLYDDKQHVPACGSSGVFVNEIAAPELLGRIGISVDKQTQVLLRQATAALRQAGWTRYRSSRGDRPWMFRRPAEDPMALDSARPSSSEATQPQINARTDSDCPF